MIRRAFFGRTGRATTRAVPTDRKEIQWIAANVRRYRLKLGISQQKLSERMGVSVRAVSVIEAAKSDLAVSTLCRLADALGVAPAKLLVHARFEPQPPGRPKPKR